jgi:hypothetical protein
MPWKSVSQTMKPSLSHTVGRLWEGATACLLGALAALLVHDGRVEAQSPEAAIAGLVRIRAVRDGVKTFGTGFVVSTGPGIAAVVTASHVIEGANFVVTFAADSATTIGVDPSDVLKVDTDDRNGLAIFFVRTALPASVRPLRLSSGSFSPTYGVQASLLGYPDMTATPQVAPRSFAGRDGLRYAFDLPVAQGMSGGPVVRNGTVIGLVTETDGSRTFVVPASVLREFIDGSGVRLHTADVESDTHSDVGRDRPRSQDAKEDAVLALFAGETVALRRTTFIQSIGTLALDVRLADGKLHFSNVRLTLNHKTRGWSADHIREIESGKAFTLYLRVEDSRQKNVMVGGGGLCRWKVGPGSSIKSVFSCQPADTINFPFRSTEVLDHCRLWLFVVPEGKEGGSGGGKMFAEFL